MLLLLLLLLIQCVGLQRSSGRDLVGRAQSRQGAHAPVRHEVLQRGWNAAKCRASPVLLPANSVQSFSEKLLFGLEHQSRVVGCSSCTTQELNAVSTSGLYDFENQGPGCHISLLVADPVGTYMVAHTHST